MNPYLKAPVISGLQPQILWIGFATDKTEILSPLLLVPPENTYFNHRKIVPEWQD